MIERLMMLVTRGRVTLSKLNPKRTLIQADILADEVKNGIELFLPYGMSAKPGAGDVIILQVGASRAHAVALFADDPALRIADLADGEFGFRDKNGQQVVFRTDRIEVITAKDLVATVTGNLTLNVQGNVTIAGASSVQLAGAGGRKVVLDGDPVVSGTVRATSTIVTAK